jgi:hypothetical protein
MEWSTISYQDLDLVRNVTFFVLKQMTKIAFVPVIIATVVSAILSLFVFAYAYASSDIPQPPDTGDSSQAHDSDSSRTADINKCLVIPTVFRS